MLNEALKEDFKKLIEPFLQQAAVVLVDFHIHRTYGNVNIKILVDKSTGGITMEECANLNRAIRDSIEAQNLIAENYTLEVSSPGLDRPLKTAQDFLRMVGREVRIFLLEPVGHKVEYTGIVLKVENENLTIDSSKGEVLIPIQNVNKAKWFESVRH